MLIVFQSPRGVQLFVTPWTAAGQASLSPTREHKTETSQHAIQDLLTLASSTPCLSLCSAYTLHSGQNKLPQAPQTWQRAILCGLPKSLHGQSSKSSSQVAPLEKPRLTLSLGQVKDLFSVPCGPRVTPSCISHGTQQFCFFVSPPSEAGWVLKARILFLTALAQVSIYCMTTMGIQGT